MPWDKWSIRKPSSSWSKSVLGDAVSAPSMALLEKPPFKWNKSGFWFRNDLVSSRMTCWSAARESKSAFEPKRVGLLFWGVNPYLDDFEISFTVPWREGGPYNGSKRGFIRVALKQVLERFKVGLKISQDDRFQKSSINVGSYKKDSK